jgi:hypothetical protein
MATAARLGDRIAAVAAVNPPLFTGHSRQQKVIYPETVDEIVAGAGERKPPLLIYAGDRDQELKVHTHSNQAVKRVRYQDSSSIPAEHLRRAAGVLEKAGFPVEFTTIDTPHYAPLPDDLVKAVWIRLNLRRMRSD